MKLDQEDLVAREA